MSASHIIVWILHFRDYNLHEVRIVEFPLDFCVLTTNYSARAIALRQGV
jgi:hypothetical protein